MEASPEAGLQDFVRTFIAGHSGADDVEILRSHRMGGGAIQENHALDVRIRGGELAGEHAFVLRTDSPSSLPISLSRAQEFAVLGVAWEAGAPVPQPLWLHEDRGEVGRDFYIMRRLGGSAAPKPLVRGDLDDAARSRLLEELGAALAAVHSVRPPRDELAFLDPPAARPGLRRVEQYRGYLDRLRQPQPTLEWALRWLERNAPASGDNRLCHGDYRTGNYLVEEGRLSGILDWEFAGWSDPAEDIGWFCARCWRFGAWDREAGGLGDPASLLRGYARAGGTPPDPGQIPYWRIMATVRWAVIALMQAERHLSGEQPSLELALTGRMLPEMELDLVQEILAAEQGGKNHAEQP